jgi:F-type H+-transporting ATPase subunit epsilon
MLDVELVSPEKILFTGQASFVRARTIGGGELAFLTGHAPFIGALEICAVKIIDDSGTEQLIAVHGGFVEVSDDQVTILSDVAELADEIDVARAEQARTQAESDLRNNADDEEAQAALKRAEIRIEVATSVPASSARH